MRCLAFFVSVRNDWAIKCGRRATAHRLASRRWNRAVSSSGSVLSSGSTAARNHRHSRSRKWTDADTFLPIVQRDTVAAVIVAALMYQPPCSAVLAVVHDGDGFRLAFLHAGTFPHPPQLQQPWQVCGPPAPEPVGAAAGSGAATGQGRRIFRLTVTGKIICFIQRPPSMNLLLNVRAKYCFFVQPAYTKKYQQKGVDDMAGNTHKHSIRMDADLKAHRPTPCLRNSA